MQTHFRLEQLQDPAVAESAKIVRSCVHCGMCTATCPTYVLLGDELDSPRGRISLIKDMLESGRPATPTVVKHIDRCLSCLSCVSTCPSGVDYMHLVDHARAHIRQTFRRPLSDRLLRYVLALVVPRPPLFRWALHVARWTKPLHRLLPGRLRSLAQLAPARIPRASVEDQPGVRRAVGARRARVALLTGCAQQVLAPSINEATLRLLTRSGCDVVIAPGTSCCGALAHHLGDEDDALDSARRNVDAWTRELERESLDAVIVNASGCGTMIKDYGFMLRLDPVYAERARRISALARDVCEYLATVGFAARTPAVPPLRVAYQAACSLQHGQRIQRQPRTLLASAGFSVIDLAEDHLCCGSAGTYSILQPELANQLRARKLVNIAACRPDVVASGNIGCISHIGQDSDIPIVHTAELLDWASGGPIPPSLAASISTSTATWSRP
jgi:glycolate oxidase iron-sulfur subunit